MNESLVKYRHMRLVSVLSAVAVMMSIVGCATVGPKYSTVRNNITALSKENARIVFYRPDSLYATGMRPDILLEGKKVGISRPGTIFYVDVDPGKYRVTIPAIMYPGETTLDITVSKNETVYVKNYMGGSAFGGRTNLEVVPHEKATTEIDELVLMTEPTQ